MLTAPVLKTERVWRLEDEDKDERLTLSMDLCRFAEVGTTHEPQTNGMPCPGWITRADSDKVLSCGCDEMIRHELHDKKSSGPNVLHTS